jgi:hypothetical protein
MRIGRPTARQTATYPARYLRRTRRTAQVKAVSWVIVSSYRYYDGAQLIVATSADCREFPTCGSAACGVYSSAPSRRPSGRIGRIETRHFRLRAFRAFPARREASVGAAMCERKRRLSDSRANQQLPRAIAGQGERFGQHRTDFWSKLHDARPSVCVWKNSR